jgi:hypothetical protein
VFWVSTDGTVNIDLRKKLVTIMKVAVPEDILHMICVELGHQKDFNTLFSCALASKAFAPSALQCLYR